MSGSQHRIKLMRRLTALAEKLPNGLLTRLVDDAQFFYDWNLGKKKARSSARLAHYSKSDKVVTAKQDNAS